MLEWITKSFFSKVGEKIADYGFDTLRDKTQLRSTLETMERNIKSLSAKASDIEEEIKNAELSGTKKRKREVEDWFEHVKIIESEFRTLEGEVQSEGFINRFLGGAGAKKLNERVYELVEQGRHLGELVLDVYSCKGEALLTKRVVGAAFEENLERIWNFLVVDDVSSIGIYGMGGVGKTTLAKHINNRLVEDNNYCVFWVTVSQEFSITKLQDKLAHVLKLNLSDEYDEHKRAARLNRALTQRKNFVLILDDVWRNISLEKVGDPLSVEGCRLIITTRSLEVCHQIGCQELISVKTLDTDEAWKLFSGTLGPKTILAPHIEKIAKSMAKVCGGLPLRITSVAGNMRRVTAGHVWSTALAKPKESVMGQDENEDEVYKELKYSFDQLSPDNQRCFLFCSLYPEDKVIYRTELINKFISEEFVDKRKSRKAQVDEGHAILDKLVSECLLENTDDDCVKMHHPVRAMALKITQGKHMVMAGCELEEIPDEETWTENLEKISLIDNFIEEIPEGMSPNCPKLTTLLLHWNSLKFIPSSFFSKMHRLCTLDLSRTCIKELPNSLSELKSLKGLFLGYCTTLISVPSLQRLKGLRQLDLDNTAIKNVPQGMGLSLKRLNLPYQLQTPVKDIESLIQLEVFSAGE